MGLFIVDADIGVSMCFLVQYLQMVGFLIEKVITVSEYLDNI